MKTSLIRKSLTGPALTISAIFLIAGLMLCVPPVFAGYQEYTVDSGINGPRDVFPVDLDEDLDEDLLVAIHFEDRVVEGEVIFDYRLRPGVVEKGNALELMRAVGLPV